MKPTPAETIARLCTALEPDFRLMPLEAPEAPLFLAVALPTGEGVTGLKPRLPAGRGMTTQQALLSAGAEALELRASLAGRHLDRLAGLPRREGLAMVTAVDLLSHEAVAVPAQAVYLDCAEVLAEPLRVDADFTAARWAATATARWRRRCGNAWSAMRWRCGGMGSGPPPPCRWT